MDGEQANLICINVTVQNNDEFRGGKFATKNKASNLRHFQVCCHWFLYSRADPNLANFLNYQTILLVLNFLYAEYFVSEINIWIFFCAKSL